VHKLGCHHVAASADGQRVASAGFGGEVKIWAREGDDSQAQWVEAGEVVSHDGCVSQAFIVGD